MRRSFAQGLRRGPVKGSKVWFQGTEKARQRNFPYVRQWGAAAGSREEV